jgi:hypothetical protein
MSITDTPAAPASSTFATTMQKAKRLLEARSEVAKLESDIRDVISNLTHAASRAATEDEKAALRQQHQRLRSALDYGRL